MDKGCKVLCISTGGKLSEMASNNDDVALIRIPSGMMPRAALGYSFTPLLIGLGKIGFCRDYADDMKICADELSRWAQDYSFESTDNKAFELAEKLIGKIVVVYSGPDYFDAVALRFKGQVSENAKQHLFCNEFPEFNHNELVGWELSPSITDKFIVLILRDKSDQQQIARRMDIVSKAIRGKNIEVMELFSRGESLLSRIFSQIQLADFTSYYLALLNGVDPTPIKLIEYLKNELAEN
jgi:glucose/mannose-6-phosphate isomerase